jgi:hypothetical protein
MVQNAGSCTAYDICRLHYIVAYVVIQIIDLTSSKKKLKSYLFHIFYL